VLVGAGLAVLLLVVVAAVLGLRGSGGQPTASPGTAAPLAPGGGAGPSSGGAPGGGPGSGVNPGGGSGSLGGSLRLPDRVAGLPRIPLDQERLLGGQQGLLDLIAGSGALDGWGVGAYGPDQRNPRFVLLVVKARDASSASGIAGTVLDAIRTSLGGDLSEPRSITRNGVDYRCSGATLGSLCWFQDGTTVGLGFSRNGDLDQLSRLTDEGRRGVRG
jgi:hypothetical protein